MCGVCLWQQTVAATSSCGSQSRFAFGFVSEVICFCFIIIEFSAVFVVFLALVVD